MRSETERIAVWIGRFCALVGVAVFLLTPQAGCGGMEIKGTDLLSNKVNDQALLIGSIALLVFSVGIFFSPRASSMVGFAILSIAAIVLLLLKLKYSGQSWENEMVEIKPGGAASIIAYVAALFAGIVGASSKKENK